MEPKKWKDRVIVMIGIVRIFCVICSTFGIRYIIHSEHDKLQKITAQNRQKLGAKAWLH